MGKYRCWLGALTVCALLVASAPAEDYPFIGRWALDLPGGGAGWLEVKEVNGYLDGDILWGGGSVVPVASVSMMGENPNTFIVTRLRNVDRKDKDGKKIRTHTYTESLWCSVDGDALTCRRFEPRTDGKGSNMSEFTGKRIPPLPPKPDLSKVKFGEPIELLKKNSLDGWRLMNPNQASGWSISDGVLVNNPVQEPGKPHKSYGNLRTDAEFEDFQLSLDMLVDKGGNSGVYLRGIYEVQVAETYGGGTDSHHMGAIYSRITPSEKAEKPAGEWQHMDITLVDRHVTVILNGKKIIDNAPLMGCTGGAMTADEFKPGPLYLQGDHTAVKYRNIVLRPVIK